MVFSWWRSLLKRSFSPARRQRRPKALKPWQRFRPLIEDLEGRLVPAVAHYIGPDNGDWNTPSNWSTGLAPGRFDDVLLDRPVNVNFTGTDPGVDVFKLTQTAGTLTITGGALRVNAPSTFGGTVRLAGPGAELGIFGDENDHTKPGQVTVNGTLIWDVGLIHGGNITVTNTGTLSATGVFGEMDLGKSGEAQTILNNTGHINQTNSANGNGNLVMDNATINNQTGGTYTFSGDYDMHLVIAPIGNSPKLMTNTGTIRHGPGVGNAVIGVPLNNLVGGLLDVQSGTVTFTGGGFGGGGNITVEAPGVLDLTGGQLPIYSGTYSASGSGTIRIQNGLLTANGVTFNFPQGMFQWTGGTIQGSGLTNIGYMNLANSDANTNQLLGGNLYNNGTITLNNIPGTNFLLNRGTLYNQSGGLFSIQTDSNVERLNPLPSYQLVIGVDNPNKDVVTGIYNSGTFRKETGTGTSTVNVLFNNSPGGVIDAQTGALYLTGGGISSGGTFNAVAPNAVLDFSFSLPATQNQDPALFRGYQNMTGTYTGSGAGSVQLSSGRIGVQGADLTFNFPPTPSGKPLFQWVGGNIDTGVQNMFNAGYINLAATSPLNPPGTLTGTLNNNGTITETGTVSALLDGGVLNNQAPGTIDFQSSAGIGVVAASTGTVNNYGTVSKSAGLLTNLTSPYNNQPNGIINVKFGTLNLTGGGNSLGGNFLASAGAVLDLTGGNSNQFLSGTYTGSGDGIVRLAGGTLNIGSGAQLVFKFSGPTAVNPLGLFQWQGGTIVTGTKDFLNLGSMTITGPNPATLVGTLNNSGTIIVAQGAPALVLSNASLNNLAATANTPTGTVDIRSDGGAFTTVGNSSVNNAGMFMKSAGASSGIDTIFNTPGGTVRAAAGTLAFNSPVIQGGTILSGGTWEADNGAVLTINSAGNILYNNATVILSGPMAQFTNLTNLAVNNGSLSLRNGANFDAGGSFQNAGTLDIGSGSTFTVTAGGAYNQTPTANTTIHIGGPSVAGQYGRLVVTGQANLNGALNVVLDNGFTPAAGDQYTIVTSSSRAGSLAGINGLQPGRNVTFIPQISATSITLVVRTAVVHTTTQLAFVIGLDHQPYAQKLDATGHAVGGYFVLQAAPGFITQVKAIAAGHDAANRPLLFAIGLDDQVYVQKFTAAGDQNGFWSLTKPGAVKSITVGSDALGDPELFAIGLDNQVWALKFDAAGNPGPAYYFPVQVAPGVTTLVKSVAVSHDARYEPLVFAIGLDDQVYAVKFDSLGNQAGSWYPTQTGKVTSIQAGFDSFLNPELFVIQTDNQVYGLHFDANGFPVGNYFLAQAGAVKSLVVSHDANNNPEVFVTGLDDQVYGLQFDASGNTAGNYFLANPGQVKSLNVGYYNGNNPEVFVTGLNDNLFSFTLDPAGNPNSGYFLTQLGAILGFGLTP